MTPLIATTFTLQAQPNEHLQSAMMVFAAIAATGMLWRFATRPRLHFTGTAMLLLGWVGLAVTIAPTALIDRPLVLGGGIVIALAAASIAARLLADRREWLLIAGAALLPLRIPVPIGSERYNLLMPLYAVITVAVLIQLRREHAAATVPVPPPADGEASVRRRLRDATTRGPALACDIPIALLTAWSALSLGWTFDVTAGSQKVALFILPFAVMYAVVRAWMDDGLDVSRPARAFLLVMVTAALIGIFQHATRDVWQNPKVEVSNVFAPDFRTNSVFWDPNIYGRYLVAAIALVLAPLAVVRRVPGRMALRHGALIALLLVALWYTYSQSSFVSLAVACVMLVFLASGKLIRAALLTVLAISLIGLPVAAHQLRGSDETSRSDLVTYGTHLASERPVQGIGIGSFEAGVASLLADRGERTPRTTASHTSIITALAELGVIGLGAFIALVVGALVTGMTPGVDLARWWAVATFAALLAHSMFYAALIEDPLMWAAVAIIGARVTRAAGESVQEEAQGQALHTAPDPA